jgi:hypothetical protein
VALDCDCVPKRVQRQIACVGVELKELARVVGGVGVFIPIAPISADAIWAPLNRDRRDVVWMITNPIGAGYKVERFSVAVRQRIHAGASIVGVAGVR